MSAEPIFIYENKMERNNKGYNFFTFYTQNFNLKRNIQWIYLQKYSQKLQYT